MADITAAAKKLAADYTVFCDYMEQKAPKLSARTMRLGKKDCFELNHLLQCVPEQWKKAEPTQELYAEIDFFHYFSLHYNIFYPAYKSGGYLPVFTDKRKKFYRLTSIERYDIMLEYMLWEYQDESQRLRNYFTLYHAAQESPSAFSENCNLALSQMAEMDYRYLSMPRLHCLFGLFHIEWKKVPDEKEKNYIQTISLTEVGTEIMLQFLEEFSPRNADEAELRELPLYEKSSFKYIFDFGDNWQFAIKIEKILQEKTARYSIIEKKGPNPTQYSDDIYW